MSLQVRWNNLYEISNLIPGGVYTFALSYPSTTGCGSLPNQSFNITVPTGDDLNMSIAPVITQLCGGGSTVETNFSYNGWSSMSIRMYDSAWNKIDENTSGNFSLYDTTQSKYYVQLFSDIAYCPNVDSISLIDSFVLGVQGAPPVIQKKIGVVCENSSGTLLNTGFAGLDAEGAAPFYFEMKLASATTYNAVTGDSMTGELEVQSLFPDTVYNFRVTDACGNAVVTDISVSKLSNVQALNTLQACVGSSYTLRAPGKQSASYDWYKSDSAGNYIFLASGQYYNIPLYAASDDGLYKCEMNFGSNGAGGCVEREFNINLNSDFCNRSIDLNEINGIVYTDFNEDTINDPSEPGTENIKVYLYDDVNHNGILEVSELNPPIDSALTTSVGFYSFEVLYDRDTTSYIVKIDTSTLPTGSYMTTDNYEYAQFTSGGNLDPNNDFGHSGCDFSSGIAAPSTGCTGEDQVFAVSPPVSGATYAWEFPGGDPATSTAATQIVSWVNPGTYAVELEVSDATCKDTIIHSIVISTGMVASAAPSDTVCRGGEVVLDASASTSTGANYVWTVESGDPYSIDAGGNTTAPTVSPYVNSTYKITVTSSTSTCANVAFVNVSVDVNRNPTANLVGPSGAIHDSSMVYLDGTASAAPATNPTAAMNYMWLEDDVNMVAWNYDTLTTEVSGNTAYGLICVDPLNGCADTAFATVVPTLPPIPVELIGLRAKLQGVKDVLVEWSTATELNNEKFEVQRRYEYETEYATIDEVDGAGNSNVVQKYRYVDRQNNWLSPVVYYRLKQVDHDGEYEYSYEVPVSKQSELEIMIYPNPAQDETIVAALGEEDIISIQILDMYGKDVSGEVPLLNESGIYTLDVRSLRNGTYYVNIVTDTQRAVAKILVAR